MRTGVEASQGTWTSEKRGAVRGATCAEAGTTARKPWGQRWLWGGGGSR